MKKDTDGKVSENIEDESLKVSGYGMRHQQAILLFILIGVSTALSSSMTVAILAMTEVTSSYEHKIYNWDKQIHGFIMSSSFWGDVAVQGIAGQIANKYGTKKVLTISIFITGFLMMSTPWCAEWADWKGVCVCTCIQGAFQGFITPCIHTLIGKWAPVNERTRFVMFVYGGMYSALIITPPIAAYVCTSFLGWPWSYYIFGAQSFVGGLLWIYFGATSPDNHKTITIEEKAFIEKDLDQCPEIVLKTPWKSILTSLPFFALVVTQIGCNWGFTVIYTETPTYFKLALGMDLEDSGLLTSLTYLMALFLSIVTSFTADYLLSHGYLSVTSIRKISNTIGSWIPALCMLLVTYVPTEYSKLSVGIFVIMVGLDSVNSCGYLINHVDLAPNYAGVLVGVSSIFSGIISLFAPIATGFFVQDTQDKSQWRYVYILSAGMYFFGNLVYLIFGSGNTQTWNKVNQNDTEDDLELSIELMETKKNDKIS